jgi:cyclopropane-fatty-acyl-phospholipid synthase
MGIENRDPAQAAHRGEGVMGGVAAAKGSAGTSSALERWVLRRVLEQLGSAAVECVLWDGARVVPRGVTPQTALHIHDRGALWRMLLNPEFQFPEMYVQDRVGFSDDLGRVLALIHSALRNKDPNNWQRRIACGLQRPHSGSLKQARENIYSHYDVGNDFYRLWLDEQMVYTCAYFPTPSTPLEDAQRAKMDLVCRKLRLRPGERVVEAGCGWGALALHMARHYGVKVRAHNISRSQLAFARERAAREGLADKVEFVEADYREIEGEYDVFVSVGMLEHVGLSHYRALGEVMNRCLTPSGRGLIHTIGADRPGPTNPWIERRIFPGGRPPSIGEMMPLFGPNGFSVLDIENLRLHYALTLRHWIDRFERVQDKVREMFDPAFVRTWRFYLVSSESAFTNGNLQLFQVLFARQGDIGIPWTRAEYYRDGAF